MRRPLTPQANGKPCGSPAAEIAKPRRFLKGILPTDRVRLEALAIPATPGSYLVRALSQIFCNRYPKQSIDKKVMWTDARQASKSLT